MNSKVFLLKVIPKTIYFEEKYRFRIKRKKSVDKWENEE